MIPTSNQPQKKFIRSAFSQNYENTFISAQSSLKKVGLNPESRIVRARRQAVVTNQHIKSAKVSSPIKRAGENPITLNNLRKSISNIAGQNLAGYDEKALDADFLRSLANPTKSRINSSCIKGSKSCFQKGCKITSTKSTTNFGMVNPSGVNLLLHNRKISAASSTIVDFLHVPSSDIQVLAIEIRSNWGSKEFLRIAQIELIGKNSARIPILNVSSYPPLTTYQDSAIVTGATIDKRERNDRKSGSNDELSRRQEEVENSSSYSNRHINTNEKRLTFTDVTTYEAKKVDGVNLNYKALYDGRLDKNDVNELWTIKWPLERTVTLIIFYNLEYSLQSVRIYNSRHDQTSSVRDINIKIGTDVSIPVLVPKGFVTDQKVGENYYIRKFDSPKLLDDMFPELEKDRPLEDLYGAYPLIKGKSVVFEILGTRNATLNQTKFMYHLNNNNNDSNNGSDKRNMIECGLNGIELYDHEMKLIDYDNIQDIILHSCMTHCNSKLLFKSNKATDIAELMFRFDICHEYGKPRIEVVLKEEKMISKIVIWNYNCDGNLKIGVKKMAVRIGNRMVWRGPIRMGNGIARGAIHSVTNIWLTEAPRIRLQDPSVKNE